MKAFPFFRVNFPSVPSDIRSKDFLHLRSMFLTHRPHLLSEIMPLVWIMFVMYNKGQVIVLYCS